jgi:hypothetical protein
MSYSDIHFLRDKAIAIKRAWLTLGSQGKTETDIYFTLLKNK